MRIISTYVGNTEKSEILWRWQLFKLGDNYGVCKGLYHHLKDCYFLLKFIKNFHYRYCLLTTWVKCCFNKVNAFEPVPLSADRQQQIYLYQLW